LPSLDLIGIENSPFPFTMTLLKQISFCSEKRFTGKLCITSLDGNNINDFDGNCWNICFYRGRLVGDSAGIHPIRRLRRQLSQQQIDLPESTKDTLFTPEELAEPNFFIIKKLLTENYIDREQAEKIIIGSLAETLFDILHFEARALLHKKSSLVFMLQASQDVDSVVPDILVKPESILLRVTANFQEWQKRGFIKYSPNLTPCIDDYLKLQEFIPVKTYKKMACLLDNEQTLRDIAVKIDEDIEPIMATILKYHNANIVSLRLLPDIDITNKKLVTAINANKKSSIFGDVKSLENNVLIAHLSNNQAEVKTIQTIVENAGHGYINLQEASQVFLTLLKYQPALILVDNIASNINTHSLCTQLRRTAKFKDTPIIFLSNEKGVMSWVKNRTAHPNEYISKPFSHQKIFTVLDKYIHNHQLELVTNH
jgi:two-component system, chemotaxis family, response regulator PixG